jgi:hypothetical protein
MSRKIVVNVEFEFYPDEDEYYNTHYATTPNDELAKHFVKTLDYELSTMNNDGLWWHFSEPKVVTDDNKK